MWVRMGSDGLGWFFAMGRGRWGTDMFKALELTASMEARRRRGVEKCMVGRWLVWGWDSLVRFEKDVEILAAQNRHGVTSLLYSKITNPQANHIP